MRAAAIGNEQNTYEQNQEADTQVVRWRVIRDDRPLLVEEAIVLLRTDYNRWRLVYLYRHPELTMPPVRWRLRGLVDAPFVNQRDFMAPPQSQDVDQFLDDTDWTPLPIGFETVASGGT
jgi:hypothetical protein